MADITQIYEVLTEAHNQRLIRQTSCINICLNRIVNNANRLLYIVGRGTNGVEVSNIIYEINLGEKKAEAYLQVLRKLGYLQVNRQIGKLGYTWKLTN